MGLHERWEVESDQWCEVNGRAEHYLLVRCRTCGTEATTRYRKRDRLCCDCTPRSDELSVPFEDDVRAQIIAEYAAQGRHISQELIAECYGVSRQAIDHIERRAMRKLRNAGVWI